MSSRSNHNRIGARSSATNAVKHGALGQAGGKLLVAWRIEAAERPLLQIEWRETGVRLPDTAPRLGQGRELIEKALPYQLDATTTFRLDADGVRCTIALPL